MMDTCLNNALNFMRDYFVSFLNVKAEDEIKWQT